LEVPATDVYTFTLESDDGARLAVSRRVVVDNDGLHSALEKRGAIALAKGWHPIVIEYFNKTGSQALEVKCGRVGQKPEPIPAARLAQPR
jgi:hexosaminidase